MEGELVGQTADGHAAVGLGEHVSGAGIHCGERHRGPLLRERAYHHDRDHGLLLLEDFEEREPVHAGHFHVERQDIGLELRNLFLCDQGVVGRPDHLDFGVQGKRVRDRFAYKRRVIDDQYFYFSAGAHGKGNRVRRVMKAGCKSYLVRMNIPWPSGLSRCSIPIRLSEWPIKR